MTTMIGRAALKLRERYQLSAGRNWLCQQAEYKLSAAQAALLHSGAIRSAARRWPLHSGKTGFASASGFAAQRSNQKCCTTLASAQRKNWLCQRKRLCNTAQQSEVLHDVGLCTAGKLALPAQAALQHSGAIRSA